MRVSRSLLVLLLLLTILLTVGRDSLYRFCDSVCSPPNMPGIQVATPYFNGDVIAADKGSHVNLPLTFIPNYGQVDKSVLYYAHTSKGTIFLTSSSIVIDLMRKEPAYSIDSTESASSYREEEDCQRLVMRLNLNGANSSAELIPVGQMDGKINFFYGNDPAKWLTDIPTYKEVVYRNIYPQIDLRLYGKQGAFTYDYIVHPGGNTDDIELSIDGIESMGISGRELVLNTAFGEMRQRHLRIYQPVEKIVREIDGNFRPLGAFDYGFAVAAYDKGSDLVIDPSLVYATYLGGTEEDHVWGIAVDTSRNVYIVGSTNSNNFPVKAGAFQTIYGGNGDAFVTKLNADGNAMVYSSYIGGSGYDTARGICVDTSGCAYITGDTSSDDFPTTLGAFDTLLDLSGDAFVLKLNAAGNSLIYSTYLGGSGGDIAYRICVDAADCAYVTGVTHAANFPTTTGAWDVSYNGGLDGFVSKFNATGSTLIYSTYLGGDDTDCCNGIALDSLGSAYVTGVTWSDNFPTTSNAFDVTFNGMSDAFVCKLSPGGNSLIYSTLLGGTDHDEGNAIAVDSMGYAYVTGDTKSNDFPTTVGAFDCTLKTWDAFVIKINTDGRSLVYSTMLGGAGGDYGFGIKIDAAGCACVTGQTTSNDFPTTSGAHDTSFNGTNDAFVTRLNQIGSALLYSTFLGGSGSDPSRDMTLDTAGCVYIVGLTDSTDFPTRNPYQAARAGGGDAFVAKLCPVPPAVTTQAATDIGTGSATLNMSYTLGEFSTVDVRFAYRRAADTVWTYTSWSAKSAAGSHAQTVTGLNPGTTYDCKAQLRYDSITIEGTTLQFTTGGTPLIGTGTPHGSSAFLPASVNSPPVVNPSLVIQSASLSQTGRPGEAAVTAVLANTSTVNGITRVRLYVNGELDAEQTVAVEAGKQARVSFTVTRSQPGTYQVYVNNTPAGSFAVDDYIHPDAILYISLTLVIVSFILGIIYIRSRRQAC